MAPRKRHAPLRLGDRARSKLNRRVGTVDAVNDLAELIALCAYLQAEGIAGDGAVWAATSALLGRAALDDGRSSLRLDNDPRPLDRLARGAAGDAAVMAALDAHRERLR